MTNRALNYTSLANWLIPPLTSRLLQNMFVLILSFRLPRFNLFIDSLPYFEFLKRNALLWQTSNDSVGRIKTQDQEILNPIWKWTMLALLILSLKSFIVFRFLCSEPLSVQFSMWNKNEMSIPRDGDSDWRCVCFNWINCNVGGAIDDGKFSKDKMNG